MSPSVAHPFSEQNRAGILCWQERWKPIHQRVFAGLHLTRDIPSLNMQGGFQIEWMDALYRAAFPKSWTHCWWGTAIPQSR
jgi:hypothetical protein